MPATADKPGKVRHVRSYPLKPGMAYLYNEGDLHSPKREVLRDYRYLRNTEYRTRVLRTEPPPITVAALGLWAATAWTAVCATLVRDPLWVLY